MAMSGLTNHNSHRARPLQASTNIIHTKIPRRIDNLVQSTGRDAIKGFQQPQQGSVKVTQQTNKDLTKKVKPKFDENAVVDIVETRDKPATKTPVVEQVGENDISSLVKNAYIALTDVHPFDEDLYRKVMSLELADDGLPSCVIDEPFDF